MAARVTKNTLEAQLQDELKESGGKETFSVKQLRRQIAAAKSGQTSRELYITGSYSRKQQA